MAVTDLTGSLPWWARNGSGTAQGPGPTGTPAQPRRALAASLGAGTAHPGSSTSPRCSASRPAGDGDDAGRRQPGRHAVGQRQPMGRASWPRHTISRLCDVRHPAQPPINNFGNPCAGEPPGPGNAAPVPLAAASSRPPGLRSLPQAGPQPIRRAHGAGQQRLSAPAPSGPSRVAAGERRWRVQPGRCRQAARPGCARSSRPRPIGERRRGRRGRDLQPALRPARPGPETTQSSAQAARQSRVRPTLNLGGGQPAAPMPSIPTPLLRPRKPVVDGAAGPMAARRRSSPARRQRAN